MFTLPNTPDINSDATGATRGTKAEDKKQFSKDVEEFITSTRETVTGLVGSLKTGNWLYQPIVDFVRYYVANNCPDAGKNIQLFGISQGETQVKVRKVEMDDDTLLELSAVRLIGEVANGKTSIKGDKQRQGLSFKGRAATYDLTGGNEHLQARGQLAVIADTSNFIFDKMAKKLAEALVFAYGGDSKNALATIATQVEFTESMGHKIDEETFINIVQCGIYNRALNKIAPYQTFKHLETQWNNRKTAIREAVITKAATN